MSSFVGIAVNYTPLGANIGLSITLYKFCEKYLKKINKRLAQALCAMLTLHTFMIFNSILSAHAPTHQAIAYNWLTGSSDWSTATKFTMNVKAEFSLYANTIQSETKYLIDNLQSELLSIPTSQLPGVSVDVYDTLSEGVSQLGNNYMQLADIPMFGSMTQSLFNVLGTSANDIKLIANDLRTKNKSATILDVAKEVTQQAFKGEIKSAIDTAKGVDWGHVKNQVYEILKFMNEKQEEKIKAGYDARKQLNIENYIIEDTTPEQQQQKLLSSSTENAEQMAICFKDQLEESNSQALVVYEETGFYDQSGALVLDEIKKNSITDDLKELKNYSLEILTSKLTSFNTKKSVEMIKKYSMLPHNTLLAFENHINSSPNRDNILFKQRIINSKYWVRSLGVFSFAGTRLSEALENIQNEYFLQYFAHQEYTAMLPGNVPLYSFGEFERYSDTRQVVEPQIRLLDVGSLLLLFMYMFILLKNTFTKYARKILRTEKRVVGKRIFQEVQYDDGTVEEIEVGPRAIEYKQQELE